MEEKNQIIQDASSTLNNEDTIFDPMESDNQIMGAPSHKKLHLQQQPKGIRVIGYTLIGFCVLMVAIAIVALIL
ncbi:hypothetical protein ACQKM9_16515 [Viridibacillus sp. NPDC093762]|uniref:hypothetical protein n=1 Tax=Viridibacillus sp. NPDC093762 TaxID=3390720 RepID=UPI003D00B135